MRRHSSGEPAADDYGRHARPRAPPALARAVEIGHPSLVPAGELVDAMAAHRYALRWQEDRKVADGKRLKAFLFEPDVSGGTSLVSEAH